MRTEIISGPCFVDEALFGIGLSYGLTSGMTCNVAFRKSPVYKQLEQVSRKLCHMQGGHNKFLETITLTLDIKAPRYWWQEFDTYRAGVTKQSESTIHTIMSRELNPEDFERGIASKTWQYLIEQRSAYLDEKDPERKERLFFMLKNDLPEGFLQRRIVCLNLKALQNMYMQRKTHRLPEWHKFFEDIIAGIYDVSPHDELVLYYVFGDDYREEETKGE